MAHEIMLKEMMRKSGGIDQLKKIYVGIVDDLLYNPDQSHTFKEEAYGSIDRISPIKQLLE